MAEPVVLAQMAREPRAGRVKTRLQPPLSASDAAALHAAMVEFICGELCASGLGRVHLWVDGNPDDPLFRRCVSLGVDRVLAQQGSDLGRRMAHVCQYTLSRYPAVVLVGSDAPGLDARYLECAQNALQQADVVLGPALDGGYVLIGLRRYSAELFTGIEWGSESVLEATLAVLGRIGWSYRLLEPVPDIDRPADLRYLPDALRAVLPGRVPVSGPG